MGRTKTSSVGGMRRVAVVEGDLFMAKIVVRAIRQIGHEAALYSDGAEAVLSIPGGNFDLVFTDLGMPRLDGLSFLRALRASQATAELPVIVLSGRDREEDIVEAFDAGATDYLLKPIRPALLAAKLRLHLGQAVPRAAVGKHQDSLVSLPTATELPKAFGDLRLLELLGHGAFGAVYRAEGPDGDVAVKLIHPLKMEPTDLTRYFREIAALSLVSSSHVVAVQGYGTEMGYHYLSMNLIDGGTADDEIHNGPLDHARTTHVGLSVVRGLQALHAQNIVHRDIKPSNILVRRETGDGVLADLGLAKRVGDSSLTAKGEFLGTLQYAAPEAILGTAARDSASNLYSLGATLYYLASGHLPFPTRTPVSLLKTGIQDDAIPLSEVPFVEIDEDLSQLVADLMNFDPKLRPTLDETESRLVKLQSK